MQIGIFAKTFEGSDPLTVLKSARAAGFETVQYNMACSGLPSLPSHVADEAIAAISHARRETGVSICALSATYNMVHPEPQVRRKGFESLRVLADAASKLAIPLLTLCTGSRDGRDQWKHHADNASPEAWKDLRSSMDAALTIADEYNVQLGIEPELANVVSDAKHAKRLLDECKNRRLEIVFDAANLFETESLGEQREIVASSCEMLAGHISIAHAKDRKQDGSFCAAGRGVLDYPHFLKNLKQGGFNGPLITHGLSAAEAPHVATFLRAL
jgi:sugar phosphate isomerase/epimerase